MTIRKLLKKEDIPAEIRNTPYEELIAYHNFKEPFRSYENAQMLVAMCMDNRKQLRIPENFSFILRTGGANIRTNEFKVAYAIAIGGVKHVALIAHDRCGMVSLTEKKQQFIDGMMERAGWSGQKAEEYFNSNAPFFKIENEIDFTFSEAERLSKTFTGVEFLPMYYTVDDNMLHLIEK